MDTDEDFQFLHPLDLITKDVDELRKIIKEKKEKVQRDKFKGNEKENIENGREHDQGSVMEKDKEIARKKENEKQQREKEKERDRDRMEKEKEKEKAKQKEKPEDVGGVNHTGDEINSLEENGTGGGKMYFSFGDASVLLVTEDATKILRLGLLNTAVLTCMGLAFIMIFLKCTLFFLFMDVMIGPEPMDICTSLSSLPCEIQDGDVTVLQGHTSEVGHFFYIIRHLLSR